MPPTTLYSSVFADSPTPVDNGEAFDLADHLVRHPQDTFFVKVSGDSMDEAGISDGDILIVDRSVEPQTSNIVVASIGDGFTVKRFDRGRLRLVPANPNYTPIEIGEDARICGVVVFAIHPLT